MASLLGGEALRERTTTDGRGGVFQRFETSRASLDFSDFGVRHVYYARGHLVRMEDARVRGCVSEVAHLAVARSDAAGRAVQEPRREVCERDWGVGVGSESGLWRHMGDLAGVLARVATPGYGLYAWAKGGDRDWADWILRFWIRRGMWQNGWQGLELTPP